jgi:hypothetical protein
MHHRSFKFKPKRMQIKKFKTVYKNTVFKINKKANILQNRPVYRRSYQKKTTALG